MKTKKIILSGILVWLAGSIMGMLTCGWLFNWVYQIPPVIWKTNEQIVAVNNMIGSNIINLISAMFFALVFAILFNGIPGQGIRKGINYGILVWLVGAFAGIASMPFYMPIATTVIVYWLIQALVMNIIFGIIVAKIYK